MSNEIDYGKLTKKIVFTENDHRQAKLIIKLRRDGLSQSAFFRHMVTAFLEDDERIVSYIDDVKEQSKARKAKTKKLRDEGKQATKDLGFSEQQLVDIFDLIAEEHPDL
jgi:hypothetical protein|tara:strand:+ start:550 stop:876 length:327 start_codon:yes stop_codon:yes gene_type:complete